MSEPINCTDSELSTYLQGLAEGYLPTYFLDTNQSAQSKSTPIASKSYTQGKKTVSFLGFPSLTMSRPLMEGHGEDLPMSSVEDSRAKISVAPGKVLELVEREADSGVKWQESLAKYDPDSRSWKTRQCLLFGDSAECLEIWPRWGIMQDGECFHARTLAEFTYEKESGLKLPTPRSCTAMQARITENTAKAQFPNLETVLARLTLPTLGKNENKGSSRKRFLGSPDFRGAKMSEGLRTCADDPIYLNPLVRRIGHDVACGMDRLASTGNGQVPRVAATAWEVLT